MNNQDLVAKFDQKIELLSDKIKQAEQLRNKYASAKEVLIIMLEDQTNGQPVTIIKPRRDESHAYKRYTQIDRLVIVVRHLVKKFGRPVTAKEILATCQKHKVFKGKSSANRMWNLLYLETKKVILGFTFIFKYFPICKSPKRALFEILFI